MIENELGLPQPLVDAVRNDGYDKGGADFSVTELISPPRIAKLKRQHGNNIVEDASDRIFSLFGQAIHTILQRAASGRYIIETRYSVEHDGAKVSGQIDLFDRETSTLQDWKITSRYATQDGPKPEWIAQGNLNRYLLWKNGIQAEAIQYIALFRDWSKMAVARGTRGYPQRQVQVLNLPIWPIEKVQGYLSERISLHREADFRLPMCTPEERWSKPARYALMKKGRKRAVKLYDTKEEAVEAGIKAGTVDHRVEDRPGEETRCLYFCPVVAWCDFGRQVVMADAGEAA